MVLSAARKRRKQEDHCIAAAREPIFMAKTTPPPRGANSQYHLDADSCCPHRGCRYEVNVSRTNLFASTLQCSKERERPVAPPHLLGELGSAATRVIRPVGAYRMHSRTDGTKRAARCACPVIRKILMYKTQGTSAAVIAIPAVDVWEDIAISTNELM